ncbi:MAG: neutral/alkaline non-lysosomal ceramidase N-terminal domain-containing protein, partial [Bdellovibrionota bacterium]
MHLFIAQIFVFIGVCQGADLRSGAARLDITGSVVGQAMMGFGKSEFKNRGIHTRLYARAAYFETATESFAFVSLDQAMVPELLKQDVLKLLQLWTPGKFNDSNVMLTATHTHAGPAGYMHHPLYLLASGGFDKKYFSYLTRQVATAIDAARRSSVKARVSVAQTELTDASFNQSVIPYSLNLNASDFEYDRNPLSTTIRIEKNDGSARPIGLINWFSVHPTSLGNENRLVSGDSKGAAAWLVEQELGGVAAFANSDEGDVSGEVFHTAELSPMEKSLEVARRQSEGAMRAHALAASQPALDGNLRTLTQWVEMPETKVAKLCEPALGYSFAAGSEDGPTHLAGFFEGMRQGEFQLPPFVALANWILGPLLRPTKV